MRVIYLVECNHSLFIFLTDNIQLFDYLQCIHSICWPFSVVSSFDYYRQYCYEYPCVCLPYTRVSLRYGEVGLLSHGVYISFKLLDNECQIIFPKWFYQFRLPLAMSEILHYSRSLSTLKIVTLFANLVSM